MSWIFIQALWPALSALKGGLHMIHCNLAKQCFFFAERDEGKEMREYLTGLYCAGNFKACARYRAMLAMGRDLVPNDIFPNEDSFRSLFAWSSERLEPPAGKTCRTGSLGWLPDSAPENIASVVKYAKANDGYRG